jgi:hypothetical protein
VFEGTMPTKQEMIADILSRIEELLRVTIALERISQPCQKVMNDWMSGGPRPEPTELQTASMVIQSVGYIRIYCRDVEKNLRALMAKLDTGCKRCHTDFTPEHFNTNGLCLPCFEGEPDAEDE